MVHFTILILELGPLDPHWFEVLSAQTFPYERHVSDQDDLCTDQEGNIKTQFEKPTADSQLFSTPKVFRHRPVVSPDTENEHSFSSEQGNNLTAHAVMFTQDLLHTNVMPASNMDVCTGHFEFILIKCQAFASPLMLRK